MSAIIVVLILGGVLAAFLGFVRELKRENRKYKVISTTIHKEQGKG